MSHTIRCLLIDDEPPAIALLQQYASMIDTLEVVGTSHSAVHAYNLVQNQEIDLLFLDIRMPVLNGLDFIKSLHTPPAVILTTAYREYALDGYDLDIIDYLLKPIAFDRFLKAVDRYRTRKTTSITSPSSTLSQTKQAYITCNINRTHHKILLADIIYIESLKDYVRLHTTNGKLVVKSNIGNFIKQLPATDFVRIHRSYAIARQQVTAYNQRSVTLGNIELPVGISYRSVILKEVQ